MTELMCKRCQWKCAWEAITWRQCDKCWHEDMRWNTYTPFYCIKCTPKDMCRFCKNSIDTIPPEPWEYIVAAAVKWEDWRIYQWARHLHVFRVMYYKWVKPLSYNDQWFVLSDGTFIDRYDAMILAKRTWQLNPYSKNKPTDILFSEDLR